MQQRNRRSVPRRIARPNGTTRELSYDAAGRLTEIRELRAGVVFHYQRLTYDADDRIKQSLLMPMPAAITLPFDTLDYDVDNRLRQFNGVGLSDGVRPLRVAPDPTREALGASIRTRRSGLKWNVGRECGWTAHCCNMQRPEVALI